MTQSETRKRKHTPEDLQALEQRARDFATVTGRSASERVERQAHYAYALALDFYRVGVLGNDFTRWLSRLSRVPRATCWRRHKLGRCLAQGQTGTESELLRAQRQKELTPVPEMDWSQD